MKHFIVFIVSLIVGLNLYAQELCNPNSDEIFVITEIMPEPTPNLKTIEDLINANFNPINCNLQEGDKIAVIFTINCEGEDFDYRVIKFNEDEVDCGLNDFLQSTLTWTKAKQRNYYVDFEGTLVFKIENLKFVLLIE